MNTIHLPSKTRIKCRGNNSSELGRHVQTAKMQTSAPPHLRALCLPVPVWGARARGTASPLSLALQAGCWNVPRGKCSETFDCNTSTFYSPQSKLAGSC